MLPILLLLILLLSTVNCQSGIQVIKYKIPFSFLVSRTIVWGDTAASSTAVDLYSVVTKNCGTQMCFVAVYRKSTIYQIFINQQNNCGTAPNCIGHSESEYEYSLVFVNTGTQGCTNSAAIINNLAVSTKLPVCPQFWYSYVRPNGRVWCYILVNKLMTVPQTWTKSNNYCWNMYGAQLNAFQTDQERQQFLAVIKPMKFLSRWMFLGATRNCGPNTGNCGQKYQFTWIAGTSTNNVLANNYGDPRWWDAGNCLTVMTEEKNMYDDVE
uniref:C-type lectin domain-containing protein n=1 Tax=Caenorhabditis japonica TaxID=281687 RepID=A0A8R1EMR9_CAEJA